MSRGKLEIAEYDGVGIAEIGDTVFVVYGAPARLHRTRWVFDRVDEVVARQQRIRGLMVITEAADLPDGPTRAENSARMRQLGSKLFRLVTVPLGMDSLRLTLVRTVMRGLAALHRSSELVIADTIEKAAVRLVADPTSTTPSVAQVLEAIARVREAIDARGIIATSR